MATLSVSQSQFLEAQAHPEFFEDGLVLERGLGYVTVKFLNGNERVFRIFEAPVDCSSFTPGEPVAFHGPAGILAIYEIWIAAKEMIVQ